MENEELISYIDIHGQIREIKRSEGLKQDVMLQAVQLWIINPNTGNVLMQKRSLSKENDPGMIDVSVSGHVKFNETPLSAIKRETYEEIGLTQKQLENHIKKLGTAKMDFTNKNRKGKYITHEYLALFTYPLESYKIQEDEIEYIFFMKYDEVKENIINGKSNMRIPYNDDIRNLFKKIDYEIKNFNRRGKKNEK